MPQKKLKNSLKEFEKALQEPHDRKVMLKLYVSGATARSSRAIENIRNFCETNLKGRYELQVIDIYQQPELLGQEDVIAAPTLIKKLPPPLKRMIGDMSDADKIKISLHIEPDANGEEKDEKHETGKEKTGARTRKRA